MNNPFRVRSAFELAGLACQLLLAVALLSLDSSQLLAQDASEDSAPLRTAYIFGDSGEFVSVSLDDAALLARWRLPEIAGLERLLPETPTGGLGTWRVYDPVYDARRHRLLVIVPTETTAFEELGHQLIGLYPPRLGVVARVEMPAPAGNPPKPPRLLHDVDEDRFVLVRPASGAGVEVTFLDADSLESERKIVFEHASAGSIQRVAALVGPKLLVGGELFDLGNVESGARVRTDRGIPVDLMGGVEEGARQSVTETLGGFAELSLEQLGLFVYAGAGSTVLARLPRPGSEGGVSFDSSALLSHDVVTGTTGPVVLLEHWAERLVLSADGRVATTLDTGSGSLSVLDMETGKVLHRVEDPRFRDVQGRVLCSGVEGSAVVAASNQLLVWSPGEEAVTVLRGVHPAGWIACVLAAR